MSDSGQLMYEDPATAFQVATMPQAVLQGQDLANKEKVEAAGKHAREKKGGFLQQLGKAFTNSAKILDYSGSKIPGWGAFKNTMETIWWPVDKLASGAYWMYSEAVSQPLTTAFLQAGKANVLGDMGVLTSGEEWAKAYGEAENISPGQAAANYGATVGTLAGEGESSFGGAVGNILESPFDIGQGLSDDDRRKAERMLYDTDYWRNKAGWKYTAGTGAADFAVSIAGDPIYPAIAVTSKAIKAGRSIQVGEGLLKTPAAEVAESEKVNKFFDWAEGKGAAEIAAHPIWGKNGSRRRNPFAEGYGEVLAHTSRDEMPLILRFAAGDETAMAALGSRSQDLGLRLARMNESRRFLDSAKFDPEMLAHFVGEESAGRLAPTGAPGIGGVSSALIDEGALHPRLAEPPYPRPETPGPRQSGWDATYGHLARQSEALRGGAGEVLKQRLGKPATFFGQRAINGADLKAAENWRAGTVQAMDAELGVMSTRQGVYADTLGINFGKGVEEATAGTSNMFGTMKQIYRAGPLAGDIVKQGDKAVRKMGAGRGDWIKDGGITSRVIRNGFYGASVRVWQTFGEKLPKGMVNHNDNHAIENVGNMLKQVRGLNPDARIGMMNEYAAAPDKVARSKVLESIHGAIIDHYGRASNLDPQVTKLISDMTKDGIGATMMKLTGSGPAAQRMSAVKDETGRFVDMVEDGEGQIVMPMAKTQLSTGDVMLPVKELERFIDRHSGYLQGFKQGSGKVTDYITDDILDNMSKMWKASTLLRPGYTLRSVSDEAGVAAVKFGAMSSILGLSKGGANFFRNKAQEVEALLGYGSHVPTTGKKAQSTFARIAIDDPDALTLAEKHGLKTARIRVSKAWPVVESRINSEREAVKELDELIKKGESKGEDVRHLKDTKLDHETVIAEHTDYLHEILRKAEDSTGRRLAEGEITYRGVKVPEVFAKEWENPIARDQVSADRAVDFLFARGESIDTGRLIKTGNWTVITPDKPNHMAEWVNGVNKQFRQDELFRLVAQDDSLKTARNWLKTADGKHHLSLLGAWGREPQRLLDGIKSTLDQYLPKGTGLQDKLARNEEIFEAELKAAIAPEDFPPVHGEELKALTAMFSRETASRKTNDIIARGYQLLGSIPSDLLVRHPTFNKAYMVRMQESIDQHMAYRAEVGGDLSITAKEMNQMYEKATTLAKDDIRQVVYDPQRTTATEALRFIYPFLSAHGDSLQRWAGVIGEKPTVLAGVSKIYNAPVAANLVTDANGSHVGQDGYATIESLQRDEKTGKTVTVTERKFIPIEERVLHLRLPWDTKNQNKWMQKNVPFGLYGAPIKIQAMNTILPGDPWFNPGTGPLVQVPASAIAKSSPQAGDFLQWAKVLPYGPNGSVIETVTPKYMRAAWDAFTTDEPGNEKYQKAYLDTYNRQVAEAANGGPPVDLKKVEQEAGQFMFLQALTAWASPTQTKETPLTGTPYQLYVDQYKKLQETDPKNAKEIFLSTYGADYFSFTASLSKSIGVAPSIAAMATAGEYKDLIDKDPEMASWIVGDVYNQGSFSSSVYRKQMETMMGGLPMREKVGALQAIRDNEVDLGWAEYLKLKGYTDAGLIKAGFRSYEERGAENFKAQKQALTDGLSAAYPEWAKAKGVINKGKIPSRISFFEKAIQDNRLQSDPMRFDLPALDMYLKSRRAYKDLLTSRGGKALRFDVNGDPVGENADIGFAWRQTQMGIVNSNTAFNDVYNRYLEDDDLS